MSKRGENIYKRKDGRWEGRYIIERTPGHRPKYGYVYARTYHEAKEKMNAERSRCAKETRNEEASAVQATTVREIGMRWMEQKSKQIKQSSIDKYRLILDQYIYPSLGEKPITALHRKDIEAYAGNLQLTGGNRENGLAPKTISDTLSILRSIFLYASLQGYPVHTDACAVRIRQKTGQIRVLSRSEQQKLTDFLVKNPSRKNLGILFSLYTGTRIGELCALRWENISLESRTVHICSTLHRLYRSEDAASRRTGIVITTPKSQYSIRTIPLPEHLVRILSEYEQCSGYLLTGSETSCIEPRNLQYSFKKVLMECGIEEANYHALRHTFATRCVELGFDIKTLSEILGHSSVNITMNRYVHPSMEMKRDHMERLNHLL